MNSFPPRSHGPELTGTPDEPWFTRDAISVLEDALSGGEKSVVEYGSGASTVWLASRCRRLVSVEHDREWHNFILPRVAHLPASVDLRFVEDAETDHWRRYCESVDELGVFDIAIVDGRCRVEIARRLRDHVAPFGMIVVDDAQRPAYQAIPELFHLWHRTETSNGVWRTDIYRRAR